MHVDGHSSIERQTDTLELNMLAMTDRGMILLRSRNESSIWTAWSGNIKSRSNPIVHSVILIAMNRRCRPMARCVMLLGISLVKLLPIKSAEWDARLHRGLAGTRQVEEESGGTGGAVLGRAMMGMMEPLQFFYT